tara:strand:- start:1399 stop:1719 length:321 start_codon:yes stop_codon:yes gene_type:complete
MEDHVRKELADKASRHPNLRFPVINLKISSSFNSFSLGTIYLETFVPSKDKKRLAIYRREYAHNSKEDVFKSLDKAKKDFLKQGEILREYYLFNEETSIEELKNFN